MGLEPINPCGQLLLKQPRLPIPPYLQGALVSDVVPLVCTYVHWPQVDDDKAPRVGQIKREQLLKDEQRYCGLDPEQDLDKLLRIELRILEELTHRILFDSYLYFLGNQLHMET